MRRLHATREQRGPYEFLGKPVGMSDIELTADVALQLRDFVAQDFFPKVLRATPERSPRLSSLYAVRELSETSDKVIFNNGFGYNRQINPDADLKLFTSLSLLHHGLNDWKLLIMLTRQRNEVNPNKINVRHRINMFDGNLFDASREVRIVRSHDTEVDEAMIEELTAGTYDYKPLPSDRLGFERPLQEGDITSLQDHLGRLASRYCALAG